MITNVQISALSMDIHSILKSMDVIVLDCRDSVYNLNTYMLETKRDLDKNLNIWIKLSIKNKDPVLLNASLTPLVSTFENTDVFNTRDDIWKSWSDVRQDVAIRHGLSDPGENALPADILAWCAGVRHILSDSSRFEGMSAKVSGKTKLLKLIKSFNGQEGLTTLEKLWSIEEASLIDDLDEWFHSQKDIVPIIMNSITSKPKKDVLLYAKRLIKLNERKTELDKLLISLELWASHIQTLMSHSYVSINLEDFKWFATCCRQWTTDIQKYCYDRDSKLKPDLKLMKIAFSKIKIRD